MYYMGSWDMNVLSDPKLAVSKNIGVFNIGDVALGDADQALAISANTEPIPKRRQHISRCSRMYLHKKHMPTMPATLSLPRPHLTKASCLRSSLQ